MSQLIFTQKPGSTQLNCFSPPVMLATLAIETLLALYTIWRYRLSVLVRLSVVTLIALATFQLSEFFVCTGYGLHAEQWSRLGFVMITMLPPLGIHIMHVLGGKPRRRMVAAAYLSMVAFIIFFLTYRAAFIGHQCTGNYVIFQIGDTAAVLYGIYYYGWLISAIYIGGRWANELIKQKTKIAHQRLQTVRALIIGYLVFLVPVAIANTVKPSTRRGIPSIMCGFAVLFALILVLYILPKAAKKDSRATRSS